MSKASGDVKERKEGNHQHSGHDGSKNGGEFLTQVRSLREAEKSASSVVEEARKRASEIEAEARGKAVEISSRAQEKSVEEKNEVLAKGREQTEREVLSIINDAKKKAEKIKASRLADKDMAAILSGLI